MAKTPQPQPENPDPKLNFLLRTLDAGDYDSLVAKGKVVKLKFRKQLYGQDKRIDSVYFPLTCMVSLLVSTDSQPKMEMATVGREGVVGAAEVMQAQGAMGLNLIQIPGAALQIPAAAFLGEMTSRPATEKHMNRHLYALTRQILHGAACNRLHSMEERCARWLLMTHDRAGQDNFPLTQEFLSHMLGVRRSTVNVATGMLKKAGFIRYVRGQLTIIDRPGLESASCECYQAIIRVYDSLLPGVPKKKS